MGALILIFLTDALLVHIYNIQYKSMYTYIVQCGDHISMSPDIYHLSGFFYTFVTISNV